MQPGSFPGKGLSTASLVLGICSLVFAGGGLALPIVGLILGIMGKKKAMEVGAPSGTATAGIILSIIGLAVAVLTVFICFSCISAMGHYDSWYYY